MNLHDFERILQNGCQQLTAEARHTPFQTSPSFEKRVRQVLSALLPADSGLTVNYNSPAQAFPDIALGEFGVEVKFTLSDTWRSVANSVQETQRVDDVKHIYLVFCKMGGNPEVRYRPYEDCVIHVRTSHVPRFEVDLGAKKSLFDLMGISYDAFRSLPMPEKMQHIREYARKRLKKGERLWWLGDQAADAHTLPIQARLYTSLTVEEKTKLRAEAALLCPAIVKPSHAKNKYDDAVLYLLTYHGVLCHQARDLFSAGSVANPRNDNIGGVYIERALKLLEHEMLAAALTISSDLIVEYWKESVPPEKRITWWLKKADEYAAGYWQPSASLFKGC